MDELPIAQARQLIIKILGEGDVAWTGHIKAKMEKEGMIETDVINTLRLGQMYEPPEYEGSSWRYRVHTQKFCVVVAFRSEEEMVLVTTWRKDG